MLYYIILNILFGEKWVCYGWSWI